ncbi:hypothetical protein NOV72_02808 [Caballeronia novacaledonica]|uniref:Polysaccharide pyruvyl transferase domain-containing protein n=1 Tax=Caballeronia novacaledonica TaxID=1544861 RepID=A0A2U3I5Z4_9BURK|nr:polysaccharide pyruvyl transferase family protein [Caballeronia novacaledonica]SPB15588.1 hypothetical protein NOV72_02808 [Caballeronia novacaledonica]
MTDSIFRNMVRLVQSSDCETVVVPDDMYAFVSKNKKKIIPYIALTDGDLQSIDLVVVHKGAMHRLGYQALSAVAFSFEPTYADEVYVCYERQGKRGISVGAGEEAASFMQHVPPVRGYLAGEVVASRPRRAVQSAVLVSAYGVGNIGDDLVSLAAKKMLQDAGVPEVTLAGPNVRYDAIRNADVVAVGGGGLFYDSDVVNCGNYLYPLQEAQRQGKFAAVLGVGVQGITTPLGKEAYATHLRSVDFLSVRDPIDRRELIAVDDRLERTIAGADMAFYMADDVRRVGQPFATTKPLALFSISSVLEARLAKRGYALADVACGIVRSLKSRGYDVLLVLHSEDDRKLFTMLSEREGLSLIESASFGLGATARLYASASLVVTSRFHALILGVMFGKPTVSLNSATGKTGKLLTSYLGSIKDQCQPLESFDLGEIIGKLQHAQPVEPREVEHCVAMTHAMRAELARRLRDDRL